MPPAWIHLGRSWISRGLKISRRLLKVEMQPELLEKEFALS